MEAPKEIYISNDHHVWYPKNDGVNKIKYIRADLAELTWDTVQDIITIYDMLCSEYYSRLYKHRPDTKIFYKEVLRRFLESKKGR